MPGYKKLYDYILYENIKTGIVRISFIHSSVPTGVNNIKLSITPLDILNSVYVEIITLNGNNKNVIGNILIKKNDYPDLYNMIIKYVNEK